MAPDSFLGLDSCLQLNTGDLDVTLDNGVASCSSTIEPHLMGGSWSGCHSIRDQCTTEHFCTAHTVCKSCQSQAKYEKTTLSFSTICLAKFGIKKTTFTSFAHVQEHTNCNFQLFSKLCFRLTFCIWFDYCFSCFVDCGWPETYLQRWTLLMLQIHKLEGFGKQKNCIQCF